MSHTLLLADVTEFIITCLLILLTVGGGVINFFKEKRAALEAERMRERQQQERQAGENMNDELESFLEEISGQNQRVRQQAQRRQRAQRERAARQRAARQRRQRAQSRSREPEVELVVEEESSQRVAQRHLKKRDLSTVDDRHIESNVAERHLESAVADHHLVPTDDASSSQTPSSGSSPIAQMFEQAGGIRNVIILNEILSPPLSRRK